MSAKSFADTNIWIYAHLDVPGDTRCERATRLVDENRLTIRNQVLHEYYSVMLKYKVSDPLIQRNIALKIENCDAFCIDFVTLKSAMEIRNRLACLIVASALQAGCKRLYTEDLQHGQVIEGLTIVNPFAEIH
jgi:predicted nucleic acid-binding protein